MPLGNCFSAYLMSRYRVGFITDYIDPHYSLAERFSSTSSIQFTFWSSPFYVRWLAPSYSIHCRIHLLLPLADGECFFNAMGSLKAECFGIIFPVFVFHLSQYILSLTARKGFLFFCALKRVSSLNESHEVLHSRHCVLLLTLSFLTVWKELFMRTHKALQAESDNDVSNEQGRL